MEIAGPAISADAGYIYWTGVTGRTFVWAANTDGVPHSLGPPVPGTSPIAATMSGSRSAVLLTNGDMYSFENNAWQYKGNLIGLPTSTPLQTWGEVKARYR